MHSWYEVKHFLPGCWAPPRPPFLCDLVFGFHGQDHEDHPLWSMTFSTPWKLLHQARELKYFGVLFTSDGTIEQDMDQCFSAASVVMQALY